MVTSCRLKGNGTLLNFQINTHIIRCRVKDEETLMCFIQKSKNSETKQNLKTVVLESTACNNIFQTSYTKPFIALE